MIIIDNALKVRQDTNNPIRVGIIGAGFMARGLVNQIERYIAGMRVVAICNRSTDNARLCYHKAGIEKVSVCDSPQQLDEHIDREAYTVCNDVEIISQARHVDIVVEATGTIAFGAEAVLKVLRQRKPVIMLNAELDATLGPVLKQYADRYDTLLCQSDGDQPGVIMNLYRFVKNMGFTPLVCGNIKGFLDVRKNPTDMIEFATNVGQTTRMITNFTDGTKLSFEQASVANATNMGVAQRGMSAYRSTKHIDELTSIYDVDQLRALGGITDFVVGAKPGPGVYVFATAEDEFTQNYLKYLKLGPGPLYSFYAPYHLCFFEVPNSIVRVFQFNDPVVTPLGAPVVEVITVAKRNLKSGEVLDSFGGYLTYGQCENADICHQEKLLPIGLTEEGVRLKRDISQDEVLTFDDVEFDKDRLVFKLYREQLALNKAEVQDKKSYEYNL